MVKPRRGSCQDHAAWIETLLKEIAEHSRKLYLSMSPETAKARATQHIGELVEERQHYTGDYDSESSAMESYEVNGSPENNSLEAKEKNKARHSTSRPTLERRRSPARAIRDKTPSPEAIIHGVELAAGLPEYEKIFCGVR